MKSRSRLKKNQIKYSPYLKHIPLLITALIAFFWLIRIIITKYPAQVANWGITQAYLPLLTPFFLFSFLLSSYIFLNIKQGIVIGIFSTLLLLFRLQQIVFETWWLIPYFIIFFIFFVLNKKLSPQSQLPSKKNK